MSKIAVKRSKRSRPVFEIDDFKYLLNVDLPKIMLGIHVPSKAFDDACGTKYEFVPDRQWFNVIHRSGGRMDNNRYFLATFLQPRSIMVSERIKALEKKWKGTNVGYGSPATLEQVKDYQHCLKALFSANCENSFRMFEESFYPLDIEYLSELTNEKLPKDLDDLIVWRDGFQRAVGANRRFTLAILTDNSII